MHGGTATLPATEPDETPTLRVKETDCATVFANIWGTGEVLLMSGQIDQHDLLSEEVPRCEWTPKQTAHGFPNLPVMEDEPWLSLNICLSSLSKCWRQSGHKPVSNEIILLRVWFYACCDNVFCLQRDSTAGFCAFLGSGLRTDLMVRTVDKWGPWVAAEDSNHWSHC